MAIAGIETKDMNPTRDDFAALLNETLSEDDERLRRLSAGPPPR